MSTAPSPTVIIRGAKFTFASTHMAFSVSQHCTITGNGQGRAGTNILARESVESVPLGRYRTTIGHFSLEPEACGNPIG